MTIARRPIASIAQVDGLQGALNGRGYNVKDYGATGDGVTDDTAAIQSCIDAAAGLHPVIFPGGTYIISSALVVKKHGQILRGAGPWYTVIRQTAAANGIQIEDDPVEHPVQGSGFTMSVLIEGLRLEGADAGNGINISYDTSYNGDWCQVSNCTIYNFDIGIYTRQAAQLHVRDTLISWNRVGIHLHGLANSVSLDHTAVARNTEYGTIIQTGAGIRYYPGDHGNQPCDILVKDASQVTLIGGNFETPTGAAACIDLESNAIVTAIGQRFMKGDAGQDIPRFRCAGNSRLCIINVNSVGFTAATVLKSAASAVVEALAPSSTIQNADMTVSDGSTVFRAAPWSSRPDNAVPTATSTMRGGALFIPGRDGVNYQDRLLFFIRQRDGSTYEAIDLVGTRQLYATAGTSHARVQQMREFVGRKNVTTAAAAYTDVTINIGAFATMYSVVATPSFGGGIQAYATTVSYSTTTGDVVIRVHHPSDTGGSISGALHYTISASF